MTVRLLRVTAWVGVVVSSIGLLGLLVIDVAPSARPASLASRLILGGLALLPFANVTFWALLLWRTRAVRLNSSAPGVFAWSVVPRPLFALFSVLTVLTFLIVVG